MYHCPSCPFPNQLATKHALEAHLATTHYDCTPYICEECRGLAKFPTEHVLRKHCESDHGLTKFKVRIRRADLEAK